MSRNISAAAAITTVHEATKNNNDQGIRIKNLFCLTEEEEEEEEGEGEGEEE